MSNWLDEQVERNRTAAVNAGAVFDEEMVRHWLEGRIVGAARLSSPTWLSDAPSATLASAQATATAPPPARVTLDLITARVNRCPHRGCATGCGNASCALRKGDQAGGAIASIRHCGQCPELPV